MDTTVAKSAKRKIAPVRPKAAKAAPARKAKKTVGAKRPKAAALAIKPKKKPVPAKKAANKKPAASSAQKRTAKPASTKPVPRGKTRVDKSAKTAKAAKPANTRVSVPVAAVRKAKPLPPAPPPPPPQLDKAAKKASLERQKMLQAQEKANQGALKVFEQALRSFHRQEYDTACDALKRIFKEFGNDVEVASRARDYIAVCEQRMEKPKSAPKSSEANYSQGVFELNAGRYEKAADLLEKAARMEPNSAYIIYSLAAAQAQLNDVDSAMESLRRAIQLLESLRNRARRDSDFSNLMGHEDFRDLVGMEEPPLVL